MALVLDGIRVIDWTQMQAGPVASMMLADLGADVIKIEDPVRGDQARGLGRIGTFLTVRGNRNAYFEVNNRNKRGITLNLKSDDGRAILYQLVEKSDVFLHNYLPSVAQALALDYDTLRARNPRLIYAVASGYGPRGPEANNRSYDYVGLARSGLMTMVGDSGMPPFRIEGGIGDQMAGTMVAFGVLAALVARERTGIAQRVDASLLSSLSWLQGLNVSMKLLARKDENPFHREPRGSFFQPLWNQYACADGKWLVLAMGQSERYWPNLCRALNIEHLRDDPKFCSADSRAQHATELIKVIDQVFATKTCREWIPILEENGCVAAPVNDVHDLVVDPAMHANEYIVPYEHPVWGRIETLGFPVTLSETPWAMSRPAPEHCQHTEEILTDLLGYSWEEVATLREKGSI